MAARYRQPCRGASTRGPGLVGGVPLRQAQTGPGLRQPAPHQQVPKGEFGFFGFVTSDWFGLTSSAQAVDAGINVQMRDGCFLGSQLQPEVRFRSGPLSRLKES